MTESELYRELGALTKRKNEWETNIPYGAAGNLRPGDQIAARCAGWLYGAEPCSYW